MSLTTRDDIFSNRYVYLDQALIIVDIGCECRVGSNYGDRNRFIVKSDK